MDIGILGFDHPVIAVRSLEQSKKIYENLGFYVPPRGSHIEWGTGNWCIMFERNYLEHRGILDAQRYTHGLENFLEKREGLMGTAFRSDLDNRDLYQNAIKAGLSPAEPRELTRNFELETGKVPVSFRLVFFNKADVPALMASLVCQHLTPEHLRKPEFLAHPNTAYDIFEMTSIVKNLDGVTEQLSKLFEPSTINKEAQQVTVTLPDGGILRILTEERAQQEGLIIEGVEESPYMSSCGIAVKDIKTTKQHLINHNVPFVEKDNILRIQPENACGLYLDFSER